MIRSWLPCFTLLALLGSASSALGQGKEKNLTDYPAQLKAPPGTKKVVFIADKRPHGPRGNHEFVAGAIYISNILHANYPNVHCVIHPQDKLPKDLTHADAVIVLLNHGGMVCNEVTQAAIDKGAGFMAIHYGVEVDKGKQGDMYLKWMGGYFEPFWSVNPHWTAKITKIPAHETTRGVKPFEINDEWYYHMRFVDGMKGVTPVLSALPDIKTLSGDPKKATPRGTNPDVYEAVAAGKEQHLAWAYDRPKGGRGFGFTGYHKYSNLTNDSFRTLLLNGAAWTAGLPVPEGGVPSKTPTKEELDTLMQDALRIGQ